MTMKRAWLLAALTTVAGCGEFDSQHSTLMLEVQSPEVAGLSHVSVELELGGAVRIVYLTAPFPNLTEVPVDGDGQLVAHAIGYDAAGQAAAWGAVAGNAVRGEALELTLVLGSHPPAQEHQQAALARTRLTVTRAGSGNGVVVSSPAGINCGSTCSATYGWGSTVTLTASPLTGSQFVGWSGACSGTAPTCAMWMTASRSVTATFAVASHTLTVTRAGAGGGTVVSAPAGISCGADCTESYPYGTTVTLTASPAAGSSFTGWSGSCAGTAPTCTVTMTTARSVSATFGPNLYALTVVRAGAGAGTVTSSPAGISCGADCTEVYNYGTLVTLTASPQVGSQFAGWSGPCTGVSATCTVTMTAAQTVTASFAPLVYQLTVSRGGAGTVTSSPLGIDCGADCTESYPYGTMVTLTASPAAGSSFAGWSGACAGTAPTCTVAMTTARSVSATFGPNLYALTVVRAGAGAGVVTSSPAGIDCGADCTEVYNYGTLVTLTASPQAGSQFAGWSGPCAGVAASCTVTMTAAQTVSASFAPLAYQLTVTRAGAGMGTVTSSPAGISCGADCAEIYSYGTSVALTASPAAGSSFAGWSGACAGSGPTCFLTITTASTVTANFN
ncbi:MAG: hypothetical protein IT370_00195 [Deltaproteobacteria bacterium]|nr:hypothetical protein [Deltaproteobacteria bacterium]